MSIQHAHTLNPVTALEFFHGSSGSFLLAGEGCYLKIFDALSSKLHTETRIFEDQAIHGIVVRSQPLDRDDDCTEVVIWGGSSLSVLSRKNITALLQISDCPEKQEASSTSGYAICTVSDWILDVAISPHHSHEFVLVTAHNTVLRVKNRSEESSVESLDSPSRSMLYSAHLFWESEYNVLLAAGTVSGEVIVWRCSVSGLCSRALHTFTGHEGSIFGVNISPVVTYRDGNPTRLLASCSDDRTIRIWEIDLGEAIGGKLAGSLAARETGFRGNDEQGNNSSKCLAMALGHASRIWSVQFLVRGSNKTVLSFGEDATTQHWVLENSKLSHLQTFAYNSGKHIFSRAVLLENQRTIVATGGADGKISILGIQVPPNSNGSSEQEESRSWDLQDILETLPSNSITQSMRTKNIEKSAQLLISNERWRDSSLIQPEVDESPYPKITRVHPSNNKEPQPKPAEKLKPKKVPKDFINRYAFVSENQVLLTTTFGRVLLGEVGLCIKWTEIDITEAWRPDLKSYSVVQSVPAIGMAFLGTANGKVFLYQAGSIQEFGQVSGKVADMFILYNEETKLELLVTILGSSTATLYEECTIWIIQSNWTITNVEQCGRELHPRSESFKQSARLMTLPKRLVVTSAGRMNGYLVLGSRKGGLALYDCERCDGPVCTWIPDETVAGDAITSISNLPDSANDSEYFVATCRDGTYSVFRITINGPGMGLVQVHQGTPPFGPMIEAAWCSGGDLFLHGFKSKNYIVWNETKQYEISSVECGGAHRNYAYSSRQGSDGAGYFIYTKASKLYLHSQAKPSHQIIKPGGHGREIKTCAVSAEGLIATGAEDTAIRIWRYGKQLDCLAVVQKHTTGIQHLRWHGSKYLFSSGGNEEFYIWVVESIPGFGIGVVCESFCPDASEEKNLRIMSFDISVRESNASTSTSDSEMIISLAYSDSTIKIYTYSNTEGFSLIANGKYMSCCLTQLRHLEIRGHKLILLTAATDGNLTVWETTMENRSNELAVLSSHRVHQSSVKSLDIARTQDQIVIATGGDDNALAITVHDQMGVIPKTTILRSAHAAAITGLSFVSSDGREGLRIVTSGNDQRVKDWSVRIPPASNLEHSEAMKYSNAQFKKAGDLFTSIADVGDLTSLKDTGSGKRQSVLVVGNGMEIYRVSRVA